MANPSKRKGSQFETDVVRYLKERGLRAVERRVMGGTQDKGDVAGIPGWVLELKATKQIDLAGAQKEAEKEAANAGVSLYASVHKKRRAPIAGSYVVIPLRIFADLMVAIHGADPDEVPLPIELVE